MKCIGPMMSCIVYSSKQLHPSQIEFQVRDRAEICCILRTSSTDINYIEVLDIDRAQGTKHYNRIPREIFGLNDRALSSLVHAKRSSKELEEATQDFHSLQNVIHWEIASPEPRPRPSKSLIHIHTSWH